jgi:hypothetical protein
MILIRYSNGSTREGVLMAIQANELRIAAKDAQDVLVFHLLHQRWTSEDCDVVTFEFPIAVFDAIGMTPRSGNIVAGTIFPNPMANDTDTLLN